MEQEQEQEKEQEREMGSERMILAASGKHLAEIAALAGVVWGAHYPGIISREQIEYMLARMYDVEVMKAELSQGIRYDRLLVGDRLVGFASYGPAREKELKLHKIYVHPDHQRRGFGTCLLNHVIEEAERTGYAMLTLSVNKANKGAIAAYQKIGFTIRAAVVVDIGGGFVMDDFVMERKLHGEG
jgi:diamine N-acetyltransferase